jgi:hypothetical protein
MLQVLLSTAYTRTLIWPLTNGGAAEMHSHLLLTVLHFSCLQPNGWRCTPPSLLFLTYVPSTTQTPSALLMLCN